MPGTVWSRSHATIRITAPPIHSQPHRVRLRRQWPARNTPQQLVDTHAGSLHEGEISYFERPRAWRCISILLITCFAILPLAIPTVLRGRGISPRARSRHAPKAAPGHGQRSRPSGTCIWMLSESLTSCVRVALSRQVGPLARVQGTGTSSTGGSALAVRCASRMKT